LRKQFGENEVLKDIIEEQDYVSIALYAGEETVRIRLAVKASSQNKADSLMNSIKKEIEKRLYEYIVDIAGLKETLLSMNVSLSFKYEGHFHFKDEFLKSLLLKNPQINIRV